MKILAIDTSCDETAAAVTIDCQVLSNIIWSQASSHAKFGGVMPSLAKRMHEERIGWVIDRAIKKSKLDYDSLDAIAVTIGPGLSIALEVGIKKAKELALKYNKKLIAVNHIEAHILSPLITLGHHKIPDIQFPSLGLVVSGGNTILVKINKIGSYETLAQTTDDALGEALDKAARMLGLGYPGGAILEKFARDGNFKEYKLSIPIIGQEKRQIFTYSGLKTAMMRLINSEKLKNNDELSKRNIYNLAASFQFTAFEHLIRVCNYIFAILRKQELTNNNEIGLLVGGGVSANIELRKRLRKLCSPYKIKLLLPKTQKLTGDNAAMIGVCAFLNPKYISPYKIDRNPNLKLD